MRRLYHADVKERPLIHEGLEQTRRGIWNLEIESAISLTAMEVEDL